MKEIRFWSDDPRLTAYALGELSGDERAAVEAALRQNPALQMAVDEIRSTAAQLEAALAGESVSRPLVPPVVNPGIRIEFNGHHAEPSVTRTGEAHPPRRMPRRRVSPHGYDKYRTQAYRPKVFKFPQVYYLVATSAAACVAVFVALRDPPPAPTTTLRTIRHEIVLVPPAAISSELANAGLPAPELSSSPDFVAGANAGGTAAGQAERTSVAERTQDAVTPGPATAFIEGDLSLIGQAAQHPAASGPAPHANSELVVGGPDATGTGRAGSPRSARPLIGRAVTTSVAPVPKIELVANGAIPTEARGGVTGPSAQETAGVGSETGGSSPRPLFSDALAPPVAGPVVAGATPPSVLPHQATSQRTSTLASNLPGSGDVIMLSPFTVSADRATGFALGSRNEGTLANNRNLLLLDDRPYAPPGAKFGRNDEAASPLRDNPFLSAARNRLSTFAIDVDSASYANVRRIIESGSPPPRDAVRIEELVNYFPYRYAPPAGDAPFGVSLEVAEAPWAPAHRIVRIGLKARDVPAAPRPAANLVFLLDVSGSMDQPNKLPLVKQSVRLLLGRLRADDRVAIVTYAGNSGLALPSTPVAQSRDIMNALDALTPGGSTNGAVGIQLAYEIARANFVGSGVNRIILCTDGDFNVGPSSEGELVRLIEENTTSGVFLTVLGFGMGNYQDSTLEKLADKGNGNYGYIDTHREAEKILVEEAGGTLVTLAKDVRVQVEFNPATVSSYRLIGYENRLLRKEDFNDDRIDAGQIGAGHTVTALYEIVPVGADAVSNMNLSPLDELRYATPGAAAPRVGSPRGGRDALNDELLTVKVRYKKPDSLFSFAKTLQFPLLNATTVFARASADFRFAAAVAQFGMILRGSPYRGSASLADVAAWAAAAASTPAEDPGGYRVEFVELVRKAQSLME